MSGDEHNLRTPFGTKRLVGVALLLLLFFFGSLFVEVSVGEAIIWWQPFLILLSCSAGVYYLYCGIQTLCSSQATWDEKIWHRNVNLVNGLVWLNLAAALVVAWFLVLVVSTTVLALLMAFFFLGASLSLGRSIQLVAPPIPANF
ncbi:hypothetical protein KDA_64060 [Dictyobacter alpinus]|uniref:Transmembrane protein n=1 Tax=Dictyobacter alpinus TaxID=2014873 RepID=A0A402BI55_9CHLR|nr:hypothetical protein [Dictyobacter alpinus]GCE30922.1 hypothetical protein KDA_64060 [Dictyobacter alpinus]